VRFLQAEGLTSVSALAPSFKPLDTRFGTQPAREILRARRLSIRDVAVALGVSPRHLYNALQGYITPRTEVRQKMPDLLGVPLEELFTPDVIALPFHYFGPKRHR